MRTRKKYLLAFTPDSARLPIIAVLVKKFDITPNIMQARINERGGRLVLDIEGESKNIEKARDYIIEQGIEMRELNKHISRDEWRCIDCGACVSVCPAEAFHVDPESYEVVFNPDKCIACESCLTACSPRAMKLELW
ncbi:MAG: L-aspartate semialdehyde sulfurtransferase ferredoxin [Candidatus Methanomethylophilaceae archaeon]|nr:L-aspartate semialdehyde sulfurtransferase ferredoxin [Candidatus Methanomethylophilaceae archaeon]MDI3542105.1 L-aspartate semialdehyde sulfurtransferase ferredoxin [Candidatus Methanomethylophilaceae archaeon]